MVSLDGKISSFASALGAFGLLILSFFEHRKTVRPSSTVTIYVALSGIKHLIILTLPSSKLEIMLLILITTRLILEMSLLVTESQSKVAMLKPSYKSLTPEELTGVLGRLLFWWINPILKEGYHSFLTQDDLPTVDQKLSSRLLRKRLILAWNQRCKRLRTHSYKDATDTIPTFFPAQPETSFTLPRVLFTCFRGEILSPIVPRLFLIVFRYSQPFLISVTIGFVQKSSSQDESMDSGYWLVVLATGTYCGIAVSLLKPTP